MKRSYIFISFILIISLCNCVDNIGVRGLDTVNNVVCDTIDIHVKEEDNNLIYNNQQLTWEASYSTQTVILKFAIVGGFHNDIREHIFKFNRVNGCLVFDYAYYLSTSNYDPPFVREIVVDTIEIQDWDTDKLFSGRITYSLNTPTNPGFITRNFWVELSVADYFIEPVQVPINFDNCIGHLLPIELDMDGDGVNDFSFDYIHESLTQFSPVNEKYTITANTLDNNNIILRPSHNLNNLPTIVFDPPFDSDNKSPYTDYDKSLGYLIELPGNYNPYSYWVTHTGGGISSRDTEGYIIIRMSINGQDHYGWIHIALSVENCSFQITDSYLNPTPNEHVSVP